MNERLDKAAQYIGSMNQELRSMQDIGKNINDLRSAFFSPKLRGNFGEQVLNDMLDANFPKDLYETQYKFKDGQTVDAVIKTRDGLIPIDSKFPVDNYRKMILATTDEERAAERNEFFKAVRKHISDIAKKYILPGEGTLNFAVMYVPSEGIFYEIISSSDELSDLARQMKVLMTSPNTMSYFLHILRLGHERIRIEENVQKVWEMLAGFQQETAKFGETLSVVARHVTNAKNAMDSASNDYGRLASKVDQIRQLK
jgi:DNA recombination protein RmuC